MDEKAVQNFGQHFHSVTDGQLDTNTWNTFDFKTKKLSYFAIKASDSFTCTNTKHVALQR